jgi:thioredoxin 1
MIQINSDNELHSLLEGSEVAIVEFTAPNRCAPCRQVAPAYKALAEENPDVAFAQLNPDELPDIAAAYGIMSVPTFLRFDVGQNTKQFTGAAPKPRLAKELNL